jgi:phosphatidylglycerophosphate synthase
LFFRRKALTDQESIKEFETKFGTFFEEFDDKNSVNLMFYFFYIVRRVFIQIGYWFIADGILQLSISIVFSFSVMDI